MKIYGNSLYFKLNGPDENLTRKPAIRKSTSPIAESEGPAPQVNAKSAPSMQRPFNLSRKDYNYLHSNGFSHAAIKSGAFGSVPPTAEGALYLAALGFDLDQHATDRFILAPIQRYDGKPVDHVLIPATPLFDEDNQPIMEVWPNRPLSKPVLDIPPTSRSCFRDHQEVMWTNCTTNAYCAATFRQPVVALHGFHACSNFPLTNDFSQLYNDENLDKLLLSHLFVMDSYIQPTSDFFQSLKQLAPLLPNVQIAFMRPWKDGSAGTLRSLLVWGTHVLQAFDWEEENWEEIPWDREAWGQVPNEDCDGFPNIGPDSNP